MTYFAHTVEGSLDKGQCLAEHLVNVAEGAKQRAAAAMPDRIAEWPAAARSAGLLHDIGKYRDGFIDYLKGSQGPRSPSGTTNKRERRGPRGLNSGPSSRRSWAITAECPTIMRSKTPWMGTAGRTGRRRNPGSGSR